MKKFAFLTLVLLLALPLSVLASTPAPGGPFNTAFRVQNLGNANANCTFAFYNAAGTKAYESSTLAPIVPGDALYVYVPSDTTVANGMYAGVVSCDQEVAAVVNFSDADSGASYSGVDGSEVATELYAPAVYDNYYNYYSNVVVQNATNAPVNITLKIFEPGNITPVYENTKTNVPAYAHVSWEQEGLSQLSTNQFYSAKITASGNVAAIVNIYGLGGTINQLYSYNAFAEGSLKAYVPVVMNNYYGYNTAIVVQNMGDAKANVTVTYSNGTKWTGEIAAGAAASLYTPASGIPAGNTLYGAVVESDKPVAVIVNESTLFNRAGTYNGFAGGGTTISVPVVMKAYYNWNSSVTCQNVGSSPVNMNIKYAGVTGTFAPQGGNPVAPGKVGLFYQPTDIITDGKWIGSATVTADGDIVCVVNQDQNMPPQVTQVMDQLYVYNGIVQ